MAALPAVLKGAHIVLFQYGGALPYVVFTGFNSNEFQRLFIIISLKKGDSTVYSIPCILSASGPLKKKTLT